METELTEKKMQQLAKQPIIESAVSTSEDGKWVIHKTVITDIKSRAYLEKVLSDEEGSKGSSGLDIEGQFGGFLDFCHDQNLDFEGVAERKEYFLRFLEWVLERNGFGGGLR